MDSYFVASIRIVEITLSLTLVVFCCCFFFVKKDGLTFGGRRLLFCRDEVVVTASATTACLRGTIVELERYRSRLQTMLISTFGQLSKILYGRKQYSWEN